MTEPADRGQDRAMLASSHPAVHAETAARPEAAAAIVPFRRVFDEHHDFVWRSLVHLGVPPSAADDALQEVFLVVHRRLGTYDPGLPIRAWLWGIARNVAHNQKRSIGREARRRSELAAEPVERWDTSLERAPDLRVVRQIVLELEPMFRDVLVLSDIEGLTAPEIAAALGANVNTISSRLRIARGRFAAETKRRGIVPGGSHGG